MAYAFHSDRQGIVDELLKTDAEFRRLYKNHEEFETQLSEMNHHAFLTGEQQLERKRLQKLKLLEKDRMEEIIRTHSERRAISA